MPWAAVPFALTLPIQLVTVAAHPFLIDDGGLSSNVYGQLQPALSSDGGACLNAGDACPWVRWAPSARPQNLWSNARRNGNSVERLATLFHERSLSANLPLFIKSKVVPGVGGFRRPGKGVGAA